MCTKIKMLKEELKLLASEIRKHKKDCKEYQKANYGSGGVLWHKWKGSSMIYREKHIAYCLLRGKTIEQIEGKNRPNNSPDQYSINRYMELYREEAIYIDQK